MSSSPPLTESIDKARERRSRRSIHLGNYACTWVFSSWIVRGNVLIVLRWQKESLQWNVPFPLPFLDVHNRLLKYVLCTESSWSIAPIGGQEKVKLHHRVTNWFRDISIFITIHNWLHLFFFPHIGLASCQLGAQDLGLLWGSPWFTSPFDIPLCPVGKIIELSNSRPRTYFEAWHITVSMLAYHWDAYVYKWKVNHSL